jgi:hypothetical protein
MPVRDRAPKTQAELAMASVNLIDALVASGANDEETLDAIERNARHLEIVLERETFTASQRKTFEEAIAKARVE